MTLQSPSQVLDLRGFFGQYREFAYDPTNPATAEFRRLCDSLSLLSTGGAQATLRQAFADALGNQFTERYGTELSDSTAWQRLCQRIGIEPTAESLEAAQEAVWSTHFNIIDLIDEGPDGQLPTFPTSKALKDYSFKEQKLFPRQCSTASAILTSLLAGGPPAPAAGDEAEDPIVSLNAAFTSVGLTTIIEDDQDNVQSLPEPPGSPSSDSEEEESSPLKSFFSHFPGFTYNSSKSATSEFYRLCRQMRWKRKSPEREEAYRDFSNSMASQFGRKYGVHMDDLGAWQRLCQRLEVDPIPDNLEEARETVFNTHVNLVELVDEGEVRIFDTEVELSEYSKRTRKIFPQSRVTQAGAILASLLRYIDSPPPVGSRRTSTGVLFYN